MKKIKAGEILDFRNWYCPNLLTFTYEENK